MRTIKFRIWDGQRFLPCHEGQYSYYVEASARQEAQARRSFYGEDDGKIEGATIQQFTGVFDKDGREIYEGDIIENTTSYEEHYSPAVVGWSLSEEVGFVLFCKPEVFIGLTQTFNELELSEELPLLFHGEYKVIGNIFENIDLLK